MISGHRIDPSTLRDYDIRGRVGAGLDADDARAIGRSFATLVIRGGGARVAVGRDGRVSSPMLEAALVEGLAAGGVDVVRIGLGGSPMLYFAEATLKIDGLGVDAGICVTGSHNPAADNGFKLVLAHQPFFGAQLADLAVLSAAGDWTSGAGTVTEVDIVEAYVDRLVEDHRGGAFRIGWDCGNGALGPVVERLVRRLPGEHHLLHTAVDGRFPNHHPDPTVEANLADLKALVADKGLDFGLAFDGDGDRIGAVDGRGRVLWGDQLLAILAEPVLADLPGSTIVADVKSSAYLFDRIAALGGRAVMARTGHSPIKAKMRETGAPIAGELSGHIFFAHRFYGHDDAAYAAVRLIEALHRSGRSLTQWRDAMPGYVATPDMRVAVDPARKRAVVDEVRARLAGADVDTTDGVRVTTADGWWLLRASGTEAALTVRAEAGDDAGLDRLLAAVSDQLAQSHVALPARISGASAPSGA